MKESIGICSNIFPGGNWPETQANLAKSLPKLRQEIAQKIGNEPQLSLDLWLSAQTATELETEPEQLAQLRNLLEANETRCEMINAFPYGEFHGKRVKEGVYRPDWTHPKRLSYTKRCFGLLHELAEEGRSLAVSSLPGSHKQFMPNFCWKNSQVSTEQGQTLFRNLREMALWLEQRSQEWGRDLHLGLEPEPFGLFENLPETLRFFEQLWAGSTPNEAEILRRRLGVNFDACHFALQFENAAETLDCLHQAGIRLSKLHLSNALELNPRDTTALELLHGFDEPIYLHQVIAQFADGSLQRRADLPEALADQSLRQAERWRVHFHLPLHAQPKAPLGSTQAHLIDTLRWWQKHPHTCQHLAMETYTWAVMPQAIQAEGLEQMLAAEYAFVVQQLKAN